MEPDFSGYATKANMECSDGRVITPGAFQHMDGQQVPLVWNHGHDDPTNILGHAKLEAREDGIYAYCFLNDSDKAKTTRMAIRHGDINMMSIFANKLVQRAKSVLHGMIGEVSLVLKGANPGAFIDNVSMVHSDGGVEELDDAAIIYTGLEFEHSDADDSDDDDSDDADESRTLKDVYDEMTEEQQNVVQVLVGEALEKAEGSESSESEESSSDSGDDNITHTEGTSNMTRNVFDQSATAAGGATLTHSQMSDFSKSVFEDFKKTGSLQDAILAHAGDYGITNIEVLFPDAKNVENVPEWITRKMAWVDGILNGASKRPFSRIKSRSADLTHEEARAKGYIKANLKKEQFFAIAQRETGPKTIYKKQKLDRDDIIDITDFDIVSWIWQEMRFMLREEIARAILVGDGRPVEDPANPGQPNPDKIDEDKIRPIATDDDFYTHKVTVPTNVSGEALIEALLRARKFYKGSGNPTMYTTEDVLTDLLLLKDKMGRRLYPTESELQSAVRVSGIVAVDVVEDVQNEDSDQLVAVLVNITDYTIGTDRGGEITQFDDFDIDYNQYKYLIEGRMSGALTKHKTALSVWRSSGTQAVPVAPTYADGDITIPTVTGVVYLIDGDPVTGTVTVDESDSVTVIAEPDTGYFFAGNTVTNWTFSN